MSADRTTCQLTAQHTNRTHSVSADRTACQPIAQQSSTTSWPNSTSPTASPYFTITMYPPNTDHSSGAAQHQTQLIYCRRIHLKSRQGSAKTTEEDKVAASVTQVSPSMYGRTDIATVAVCHHITDTPNGRYSGYRRTEVDRFRQ